MTLWRVAKQKHMLQHWLESVKKICSLINRYPASVLNKSWHVTRKITAVYYRPRIWGNWGGMRKHWNQALFSSPTIIREPGYRLTANLHANVFQVGCQWGIGNASRCHFAYKVVYFSFLFIWTKKWLLYFSLTTNLVHAHTYCNMY